MHRTHIPRVQPYSPLVVLLSLFLHPHLVIAKRPVVERLKMRVVDTYGHGIVIYGLFVLFELSECKPSIVVKVSLVGLELNGLGETLDGSLEVAFPVV